MKKILCLFAIVIALIGCSDNEPYYRVKAYGNFYGDSVWVIEKWTTSTSFYSDDHWYESFLQYPTREKAERVCDSLLKTLEEERRQEYKPID